MNDTITLIGFVATEPTTFVTGDGLPITKFRLACGQRRFDRDKATWVDTGTNWYSVKSFRQFAKNVAASLAKGDRVVVTGRLSIRDWQSPERSGTSIDVEAEAIGHDLSWGSTVITRIGTPAAAP